ncbi:sigma-70 family RNA polymerase sigma factor [Alicyclobacillaceae bacterium I2511]|nr:sigma-70 family RNA polymerase sigma factor [Alicyclobacillaceae bacterium I2511]
MEERTMGDSDTAFVQRAQSGDTDAVLTLMQQWDPIVLHIAYKYFLKGAEREDLVQEGRIGLLKAIRDYQEDKAASFRGFAVLCVRREIISAIKKASRRKHDPLNTSLSLDKPFTDATFHKISTKLVKDWVWVHAQEDPVQHLLEQEARVAFETGMAQVLSPLEREVLLRRMEGQTYKTMAVALGRTPKSIDNAWQRVKEKVHLFLQNPTLDNLKN